MATAANPALLRHRLRTELRRGRAAANLPQRQVADDLGWSASKVIRIEQGDVGVSKTDLKALLELYGLLNRFEELAVWASSSRKQPFSEYSALSPEARKYFGHEASASIIRSYEPQLVHGLLQTDDYARAILTQVYKVRPNNLEQYIDVRRQRRQLLHGSPDSPKAFFIMSEAVVRNPVGGVDVMRRQLERLIEIAERPKVKIQILPLSRGANFGMRGPFVYLEFPAEDDRSVLYLEDATGERVVQDDPQKIEPYMTGFQVLEKMATPNGEIVAQVKRYIEDLGR